MSTASDASRNRALRPLAVILLAALTAIPLWYFTPPLSVEKINWRPGEKEARFFTDPGKAGMTAFGQNCAGCHGLLADGGQSAPPLLNRSYAIDFRDSPKFHSEISRQIPAHNDVFLAAQNKGRLKFNELELMAKFLREARQYMLDHPEG